MKNWEVYRDVIEKVNLRFNLNLHDQDLGNMPSRAELALDKINRVALAKMRGEWTLRDANQSVLDWLQEMEITAHEGMLENTLEVTIPRRMRSKAAATWKRRNDIGINLLKPNSTIFGSLVMTFFACIPLAYYFDWFIGGVIAAVCLIGMSLLNRFPSQFRYQTFHDLSEEVRKKRNEFVETSAQPSSSESRQILKAFIDESYRAISEKQMA
jgi:hypothetical protein